MDNSPPPEPHDVRAHLLGGVPVAEIEAKRPLFDALGFDPSPCSSPRAPGDALTSNFAPALTDRPPRLHRQTGRAAIRPLVESDPGVQVESLRCARPCGAGGQVIRRVWPTCPSVAISTPSAPSSSIPSSPRSAPLGVLDRFKLAGVIATWWTDTLPDFKTLLENGFPGVIDGWVDAIADAVEDDEAAGPAFDPFAHKLVRRTMTDYLERIAAAKADIARLKGEKEAFEQSNAPDDLDEEELANWNYAKDLDRQIRELKAEHKDALEGAGETGKGRRQGRSQPRPTGAPPRRAGRRPAVLDQLAAIEAALAPYEQIKRNSPKPAPVTAR